MLLQVAVHTSGHPAGGESGWFLDAALKASFVPDNLSDFENDASVAALKILCVAQVCRCFLGFFGGSFFGALDALLLSLSKLVLLVEIWTELIKSIERCFIYNGA